VDKQSYKRVSCINLSAESGPNYGPHFEILIEMN